MNPNLLFNDLNFKKLDFTNYRQIKSFIFKKNFYKIDNKYVQSFEFLNFSQNLGGKMGISLSKKTVFDWYILYKNKIKYPWSDDLTSKRLISLLYNYEFINSSSTEDETYLLNKIILLHIHRIVLETKFKNINKITSYDLIANNLSYFILNKKNDKIKKFTIFIINKQIDKLGMHKSYNVLEHAKFLNNLDELKSIFLYFENKSSKYFEEILVKMKSVLNSYFHIDGSIPLFNGANNNYTNIITNSLNKDEYLKTRNFSDSLNGLAFFSGKNKRLFFDVIQPNNKDIPNNLNAGTLSFEYSCFGEKLITNCGASESLGKNPEYLRYSAAHSTVVLQNTNISEVKQDNSNINFPQSVTFESNQDKDKSILIGSHNGYQKKFKKIIKRKLEIHDNENKIYGEDSIIATKYNDNRIIYHIRFHLVDGIIYNFTNNKKNIILKSKLNNMYMFKSDTELIVEDSILVDKNMTIPTKQIVIKGITKNNKQVRKWSIEKI